MQSWICTVCTHVYHPAEGDAVNEVPRGTSFEDLLESWACPVCKAGKRFFVPFRQE